MHCNLRRLHHSLPVVLPVLPRLRFNHSILAIDPRTVALPPPRLWMVVGVWHLFRTMAISRIVPTDQRVVTVRWNNGTECSLVFTNKESKTLTRENKIHCIQQDLNCFFDDGIKLRKREIDYQQTKYFPHRSVGTRDSFSHFRRSRYRRREKIRMTVGSMIDNIHCHVIIAWHWTTS